MLFDEKEEESRDKNNSQRRETLKSRCVCGINRGVGPHIPVAADSAFSLETSGTWTHPWEVAETQPKSQAISGSRRLRALV